MMFSKTFHKKNTYFPGARMAMLLCALTTLFLHPGMAQPAQAQSNIIVEEAILCAAQDTSCALLVKGKYLTGAADCYACHTGDDSKPYAGGQSIVTPLGTIYATNITSDIETGIGTWSDDEFYRTLNEGLGKNGEHLYPAMPYDAYTGISYEDASAIKAYLFSLPAIKQHNTPHQLQFPYNHRQLLWGWKMLNFHEGTLQPKTNKSDLINRGAYIGEALAHCGVCHTPRTITLATDTTRALTGTTITNGWFSPNVTPDQFNGIGKWTDDELKQFLRTGYLAEKGHASGPMANVVRYSLAHLTDTDMNSLIAWLRDVPFDGRGSLSNTLSRFEWGQRQDFSPTVRSTLPYTGSDPFPPLSTVIQPAQIYYGACASCHGMDGQGLEEASFPKLTGNTALGMTYPNNVILTILDGANRKMGDADIFMPAFKDQLTDEQVMVLTNWLFTNYGRPATQATLGNVNDLRLSVPVGEAPIMGIVKAGGVALISVGFIFVLSWIIRFSPRIKAYIARFKRRRIKRR